MAQEKCGARILHHKQFPKFIAVWSFSETAGKKKEMQGRRQGRQRKGGAVVQPQ